MKASPVINSICLLSSPRREQEAPVGRGFIMTAGGGTAKEPREAGSGAERTWWGVPRLLAL